MAEWTGWTMVKLEPCRYCKGSCVLGTAAGNKIMCEACWGAGVKWVERAYMEET